MIITAADPGISTGLVTWKDDEYNFTTIVDDLDELYNYLRNQAPELLLFENFKHRPRLNKAELYSVQAIGVLRLWALQNRIPTESYLPAQSKAFWDMPKIKKLGLWKPGRAFVHEMDALKVLLTYRMQTDEAFKGRTILELGGRFTLSGTISWGKNERKGD